MNIDPQVWLPLVSGLIGALVGGAASTVTVLVQGHLEGMRYRLRVITELAKHEIDTAWQISKEARVRAKIPPPVVYLRYYSDLLRAIESNKLTLDKYREINADSERFMELTVELNEAAKDERKQRT